MSFYVLPALAVSTSLLSTAMPQNAYATILRAHSPQASSSADIDNEVRNALSEAIAQTNGTLDPVTDGELDDLMAATTSMSTHADRTKQERATAFIGAVQSATSELARSKSRQSSLANCRREYALQKLHLKSFQDPVLSRPAVAFQQADMREAIARAKAGGYDQASAVRAARAQGEDASAAAAEAKASAMALAEPLGSIDRYGDVGLPADFSCTSASAAAVCAYYVNTWVAVVSFQTAEGLSCGW